MNLEKGIQQIGMSQAWGILEWGGSNRNSVYSCFAWNSTLKHTMPLSLAIMLLIISRMESTLLTLWNIPNLASTPLLASSPVTSLQSSLSLAMWSHLLFSQTQHAMSHVPAFARVLCLSVAPFPISPVRYHILLEAISKCIVLGQSEVSLVCSQSSWPIPLS